MTQQRPSLSPMIKWSGGKRSEIPFIKPAYPNHVTRIIEPFSGGAAVSFDLNPDHVVLNDVSSGLVSFYQALTAPKTAKDTSQSLLVIDRLRKEIADEIDGVSDKTLKELFIAQGKPQEHAWIKSILPGFVSLVPPSMQTALREDILENIRSKASVRIPNLQKKTGQTFSADLQKKHLETAIQSGVYTTLRRVYNGHISVPASWQVAAWYAVRSLCYSGMFRYSKNGDLNVPYGGIAYNSRNFAASAAQLTDKNVLDFFLRTSVHELDFEKLFDHYDGFSASDFIFVDPPYDSAFSQYNNTGDFTSQDQTRLAQLLKTTQAQWMLVIKKTPFILSLYQDAHLHRGEFSKNYQVNFRNRHDRGVEHLVVTNYPFVAPDITPLP